MENESSYSDIEYYTLTKDEKNQKIDIKFDNIDYNGTQMSYLGLEVSDSELPENVYDFVIDPGHGGISEGETYNGYKEADLMLDYAESLKTALEAKGYKVKLTRDRENSETFTTDEYAPNGRISIACESKAKYMISLHISGTSSSYSGFEIYIPNDCNLELANTMSTNIFNTGIGYSNLNSFKVLDGVYTQNFNENMIAQLANTANNNGYEPYNITTSTPYLYTIREVGGIATNAYVDGRNTNYSANKYYQSNQGIECYQIYIGYFNNNFDYIINSKDIFANAIANSF